MNLAMIELDGVSTARKADPCDKIACKTCLTMCGSLNGMRGGNLICSFGLMVILGMSKTTVPYSFHTLRTVHYQFPNGTLS